MTSDKHSTRERKTAPYLLICLALTVAAGVVQIALGSFRISIQDIWRALLDPALWKHPADLISYVAGFGTLPQDTAVQTIVVWDVRLPRVLAAVCVGINLAISGTILQTITRNDLAGPYILGVSGGSGLAALIVLAFLPSAAIVLPVIAALGGFASFLVVYAVSWRNGTTSVRLVMGGVIVGTLCSSVHVTIFLLLRELELAQSALMWMVGSLVGSGWTQVRMIFPWTVITCVAALLFSRQLDIMLLGEERAAALGMKVEHNRFIVCLIAVVAAASAVCIAGLIGFVGLIVPHIARGHVGPRHHRLLVAACATGAALMTCSDALARLLFSPSQIPVGIVTGILGGGYFLYLMRRKRTGEA